MENKLRETFTQALLASIAQTQKQSGREIQTMTEETVPLLDLVGFDSHNGIEVEVLLSIRLGIEVENIPFRVGKRGSKELKVREIISALLNKYGKKFSDGLGEKTGELVVH